MKMTRIYCFWAFATLPGPTDSRRSLNLRASIEKVFIKHCQRAKTHESGRSWKFYPRWDAGSDWSRPSERNAKRPDGRSARSKKSSQSTADHEMNQILSVSILFETASTNYVAPRRQVAGQRSVIPSECEGSMKNFSRSLP
jgi:hypothetical protein